MPFGLTLGSPRGVLSDADIWHEIRTRTLVSGLPDDPDEAERAVQASSYDLHVGHIITAPKEHVRMQDETLYLRPGGMAILATREVLNLAPDITGLIVPRDRSAKQGLLILNAGHVDPGHKSFVTAQAINLGKESFPLRIGGSYFSIVFEYLCHPASNPRGKSPTASERLADLAQQATQLVGSIIEVQREELERGLTREFVSHSQLNRELLKRSYWILLAALTGGVAAAGIFEAVIVGLDYFT